MPLADLLMERFKVRTRAVENSVITSVGTTALEVLQNNPNRLGGIISNLSVNTMYLGLTNRVSATNGVRISPNGGRVSLIWDEDFQMVGWAWWVIATSGSSALFSIEVVEY